MPRRKPGPVFEEDGGIITSQEELDFEAFMSDIGDEPARVSIFRYKPDGDKEQIKKVGIEELREDPYDFLRQRWGPGKYWLVFRGAGGLYKGGKTIVVGDPTRKTDENRGGNGNGVNSDLYIQMLKDQAQAQREFLTVMLAAVKGPDLGTLLQGIAAMKPNMPDPAAMLVAVSSVFTQLRGTDSGDPMERVKTIIELAKTLMPSDGSREGREANGWSVLEAVASRVADKVDVGALVGAPANRGVLAAPVVAPGPVAPAGLSAPVQVGIPSQLEEGPTGTITPVASVPQTNAEWIAAGLKYLKTKAAMNKDPGWYVDRILEDPEEPQNGALIEAIKRGVTFDQVLAFDPEIANNPFYRSWFQTVYDGLKAELSITVDSPGSSRDTGNSGSHAEAGLSESVSTGHSPFGGHVAEPGTGG